VLLGRRLQVKLPSVQPHLPAVLGGILGAYLWLIRPTLRISWQGKKPNLQKQAVYTLWHGQLPGLYALIHPYTNTPLSTLVSKSKDGQIIKTIGHMFGVHIIPGSSGRKSAVSGFRNLLRAVRQGHSVFLTPDGPRGPAHKAKRGATELAAGTRLPLVPCAVAIKPAITIGSWDALRIPLPFSTLLLAAQELPNLQLSLTPEQLTTRMNALSASVHQALGLDWPSTKA
jgi:lysophospholipid acyltransferase (LPLAT)-like uncharacterized protein